MFNVTVIKVKDMLKYLVGLTIIILAIVSLTRYLLHLKEKNGEMQASIEQKIDEVSSNSLIKCLDKTLPLISSVNEENEEADKEKMNYLEEFFKSQISLVAYVEDAEIEIEENEEEVAENENGEEKIELAKENQQTEVVTNNPITESFNVQYKDVKIKNQTTYTLTDEMLEPNIQIENKNIILFHTHSCESYTSSPNYEYTPTGTFRTTDLNFTVTRVGTELEKYLKQYNYNVIHDTSYHDYPAYNGSYTRSLQTVENLLKTNQADIIIDIHRDAIGSRSDYAPTVKIGDDYAAQIMFVIGTNGGGLWHPNWNQNLKFAIKVQQKAQEMYPRFVQTNNVNRIKV